MPVDLHIGIDDAKFTEAVRAFERLGDKQGIHKALAGAVNRATTTLKATTAAEIRKEYTTTAATIKEGFRMSGKATAANPGAIVRVSTKPLPMIDFKISPTMPRQKNPPKALNVTIKKGETKNTKYFVAQMPSRHIGVFERIAGTRTKNKNKEQIREKTAVSVADMTENEDVLIPVLKAAEKTLQERFGHEVKRLLGQL